jgi:hypothetical protein
MEIGGEVCAKLWMSVGNVTEREARTRCGPGLKPKILTTSLIAAPEGTAPLTEVRGFHHRLGLRCNLATILPLLGPALKTRVQEKLARSGQDDRLGGLAIQPNSRRAARTPPCATAEGEPFYGWRSRVIFSRDWARARTSRSSMLARTTTAADFCGARMIAVLVPCWPPVWPMV